MNKRTYQRLTFLLITVLLLAAIAPAVGASAPAAQPVIKPIFGASTHYNHQPQRPTSFQVVAQGLNNPRGMTFGPDGSLYIAEAGVGGSSCFTLPDGSQVCWGYTSQVTRVLNGQQTVFSPGLISLTTPDGEGVGLHDVAFDAQGNLFGIVGLGTDPAARDPQGIFGADGMNFGQLVQIHPDGTWQNMTDVAGYEGVANPDGGVPDSDPFSLLAMDNGFAVTDAGGNDLLSIDASGVISTVAVFPDRMVEFPPGSGNMIPMQSVPTSVQMAPDGSYSVAQLTGFPFPVGGANVYRVPMGGEPEVYASGFTNILDTAFGPDGSLYVVEMAHESLLSGNPMGALYRVAPDGMRTMITTDLFLPTGLAYGPDGALYVAEYGVVPGMGRVVRIAITDSVMVDPDTAMVGQTVTVHAHAMNYGGDAMGVLHIVPIDRNLLSYVNGSVFGGAIPVTVPLGEAVRLFQAGGEKALRAAPNTGTVVAVAWVGNQMGGTELHFGFQAMVEMGAAGAGATVMLHSYQMNNEMASASAMLSVPALRDFQVSLQNGVNGYSGASDTFLNAWMPMMPYGASTNFYVRQPGVKSALVKFDLSSISNVAHVSQAQIGVWVTYGSGNAVDMTAYAVLKPWSEAAATWMEADAGMAWEMPGAMGPSDHASTIADHVSFGGYGRWVWFDVTDEAQAWVMHPDMNHGIVVMGSGSTNAELEFTSSDYIVTFVRPQMKVIYQAP